MLYNKYFQPLHCYTFYCKGRAYLYIYRLAPCTNGDCVWHCTNDYIHKQHLTTKNLYQSFPGYGESFGTIQYLYYSEGFAKEIM